MAPIQIAEFFNLSVFGGSIFHDRLHSHQSRDVIFDAVCCFHLLKKGGIMAFDDYKWHPKNYKKHQIPRMAIDAFIAIYVDEIEVLERNWQIWIKKK